MSDPGGAARSAPPRAVELVARAEALVPRLRGRAAETEALRRIPDATLADLHAAGLFRMLQPARVGGAELPWHTLVAVSAMIARGCGSTGWVLSNLASHHWMLAMWPGAAQDEVWGADPDQLIGSALVFPCGRARAVAGGYRLSGRWPFASGIDACAWNMVGGIVRDDAAAAPGSASGAAHEHRLFLVPRSDYTIIDTWFVAGLKGTGSKDVEIDDVFVPAHRTVALDATRGGPTPGAARNPAPLYRLPLLALFPYVLGAVALGIAEDALAQYVEATRSRVSSYTGRSLADFTTLQARIAEASASVDTASWLMARNCEAAMAIAEAGGVPSLADKARFRRDGAFAAGLCTKAVDLIFTASGGGGLYDSNPIQRAFRDVHAANAHYALSWDVNGALYGRVALGLPPDTTL
jgi:3-hydroxy-9,10-secoandrosta-1,3,5(10)-triene-9,17-dione monooxygenase